MNRLLTVLLLGVVLSAVPACESKGTYVEPPSNTEMVSNAKQMVIEFVATSEKNPRSVGVNAAGLAESVEAVDDPALDPLKETARTLATQASSGASKSEITATLKKLKEQANAL
ncbi:hypothetical protein FF011L_38580 [Roseimaritima multifibrata]|uniref:Uncharacterized protein n=1 Tax=Roseimaritima multifibrata TaxID=1930274 RepID=A0A517MJP0_9BACT|nr:hypothetical protein [Roseimaritima multifibrata]QDS95074.1 hypothetical protein FF011L_38580 [Roseimaritima multifibrata]